MKIISISGLDGSGKSTQAQMLQEYLEQQGKRVHYFHAIQFSLAQKIKGLRDKYCLICRSTKAGKNSNPDNEQSVTKANWLQIKLRKILFILDVLRFKNLKKKLTRQGFDFIVSDRYFYDSVVNISYLENRNTPSRVERFIPKANQAFYIKIQPESIMTRDRVPDQGLNYLKDKKKLYDMYAIIWNFTTFDGSKNKNVLHEEIRAQVKNIS
jgi:thymidylate kinase